MKRETDSPVPRCDSSGSMEYPLNFREGPFPTDQRVEMSCHLQRDYAVVEFSDGLAVVSTSWMSCAEGADGKHVYSCWCPDRSSSKGVRKMAKGHVRVDKKTWVLHASVKVLGSSNKWEVILNKEQKAQDTSCLETEEEERGLRRTSRVLARYQHVSSEEDDLDQGQRVRTPPVPVFEKHSERPSTSTKRIGEHHSMKRKKSTSCDTISSASTSTGFEVTVIRMLTEQSLDLKELRERVDHNTSLLNDLCRQRETDASLHLREDPLSTDLQLDLPLTSSEDLQELELKLEDVDFADKLVLKLAVLGGKDVPSTTKTILANLLTPELARDYNWTGTKGKKEFKNFNINKIILRAVRQNPKTKEATKDEVKRSITSFLYNARDLKGGRCKRRRQEAEQESGPSKRGRVEMVD